MVKSYDFFESQAIICGNGIYSNLEFHSNNLYALADLAYSPLRNLLEARARNKEVERMKERMKERRNREDLDKMLKRADELEKKYPWLKRNYHSDQWFKRKYSPYQWEKWE